MRTFTAILFSLIISTSNAWAGIGAGHHVNVISFQAIEGSTAKPAYPASLNGSMAEVIAGLKATAEPFVTIHSPHIHSGDMVNIQADVLGHAANGELEDDGLNCQLSYEEVRAGEFNISGLCTLLTASHAGGEKRNLIVTPKKVRIETDKASAWILLVSDPESGTGIYASIEP